MYKNRQTYNSSSSVSKARIRCALAVVGPGGCPDDGKGLSATPPAPSGTHPLLSGSGPTTYTRF